VSVAAVVLAAGGGSRFSGPQHKLRAELRGRPILARVVDTALEAALDDVIVVTGAESFADLLPPGVVVVANPLWQEGMATSLAAGWRRAAERGHDAIVIGLADQPFVPAAAWRAVAAAPGPLVTAVFDGRRRPPVKLAAEVWPLLPESGDEGARALMPRRPSLVSEVACEGEPADIDTTEDAARWS
jgi:CTP:molybdopterin cytidylyltransferase MocA